METLLKLLAELVRGTSKEQEFLEAGEIKSIDIKHLVDDLFAREEIPIDLYQKICGIKK
ncbi:hypothetical protein GFC29_3825 (plasmid) [Anoxybacillus sp. B7M1]|uniref:hypothetical protein n=1 Tax=Anoxybacillus sp. B7M1 TaxID=1490057 RepID=UPI0007B5EFD8|nr:hypothetical protein [Anoxybacillus sp. B7M1]ANB66135.1 hypothetical protein GFC29_3825 [Anoxybacillus sp. B7M1]